MRKTMTLTLLVLGLFTTAAFAARSGPTIAVSPGPYFYGQTISVSTDAVLDPGTFNWFQMNCYQDGVLVESAFDSPTDGTWTTAFGPTASWTGGPADCTIQLLRPRKLNDPTHNPRVVAETSFQVGG